MKEVKGAVFTPSSIKPDPQPQWITPSRHSDAPHHRIWNLQGRGGVLGDYYHIKFGSIPVTASWYYFNVTLPGGGTTDYAVEIYYEAVKTTAIPAIWVPEPFWI